MFFNQFPYTDFHELNLDFILKNYKKLLDSLKEIDSWIDVHQEEYEQLKQIVDDLESGNFSQDFINSLVKWYQDEHISDLVNDIEACNFIFIRQHFL